jgi:hypothetical protein
MVLSSGGEDTQELPKQSSVVGFRHRVLTIVTPTLHLTIGLACHPLVLGDDLGRSNSNVFDHDNGQQLPSSPGESYPRHRRSLPNQTSKGMAEGIVVVVVRGPSLYIICYISNRFTRS